MVEMNGRGGGPRRWQYVGRFASLAMTFNAEVWIAERITSPGSNPLRNPSPLYTVIASEAKRSPDFD